MPEFVRSSTFDRSIMNRRKLLKAAGVGGLGSTAATFATPALAQLMPEIRWRLTSAFPKSLDVIYGAAETFSKALSEMTDGRFQVRIFSAGEIVASLGATDAVSTGSVEMCHSSSATSWGKDPTFIFGAGTPFGLNQRQQNAWLQSGRGADLLNAFYLKQNLIALPAGNTGAQMAGWFRRPVNSPADLNGLKIRIGGPAAEALQKLGAVPQQMPASEIYPALEKGTLDAGEWFGPHDDEKLGFYKVAKYYYYPAWSKGQSTLHFFVNQAKWNELPKTYQGIARAAAQMAHASVSQTYDALNIVAVKRLVAAGAELKPLPEPVLDACFTANNEVLGEIAARNSEFKTIYEAMRSSRADGFLLQQIAENTYDTFMMMQQRKRNL